MRFVYRLKSIIELHPLRFTVSFVLLWLMSAMAFCYFHGRFVADEDVDLAMSCMWALTDHGAWLILAPLVVYAWKFGTKASKPMIGFALSLLALPTSAFAKLGLDVVAGFELQRDVLHAAYLHLPKSAAFLAVLGLLFATSRVVGKSTSPDATQGEYLQVDLGSAKAVMRQSSIRWVRAAGNYCEVNDGYQTGLVRSTLTALQEKLDPARFRRVHRSFLINLDHVDRIYRPGNSSRPVVLLKGSENRIPVSRSGLANLRIKST